jgi:Flp pilus assembly protein TadB
MSSQAVPGGVVHELPADLCTALIANTIALAAWSDITPLACNEFIYWVEDAKQETTRKRRIPAAGEDAPTANALADSGRRTLTSGSRCRTPPWHWTWL